MKLISSRIVIVAALCLWFPRLLCGDEPHRAGGPCEYETIEGVAKVTAINVIDNGGTPSTLVDFEWTVNANDAPESMRLSIESLRMQEKDTAKPTFTVGSRYNLILKKIVKGTCTPRIWTYVGPAK